MKTNVSQTSINAYHGLIKGEKENNQDNIVLKAIKELGTCSSRMIHNKLNNSIELSSVVRSVNNLRYRHELIECSEKKECQISGVNVQWYKAKESQLKLL